MTPQQIYDAVKSAGATFQITENWLSISGETPADVTLAFIGISPKDKKELKEIVRKNGG